MRLLLALARLSLLAFPRRFRREHGRALLQTFADDVKTADGRPAWGSGLTAMSDLVRVGLMERVKFTGRLRSDLWQAWRSLAAQLGATAGTVAIFSLGVGLVAAMFALTDPFILRPLPYARPHELVAIELGRNRRDAPVPSLDEWRAQSRLFQGIAVYANDDVPPVSIDGRWRPVSTFKVSGDFFDVLGVPGPKASDWRRASTVVEAPVVWSSRGRARSSSPIRPGDLMTRRDDRAWRVLGVLSPSFTFPSRTGQPGAVTFFAEPDLASMTYFDNGGMSGAQPPTVIARLRPGITPEMVRDVLPGRDSFDQLAVVNLSDWLTRDMRPLAWGAFASGALVLLVCAGNVANIFVARGTHRLREFATRAALGASRRDILRLWIVELVMVTGAAITIGLSLAWASLDVVSSVIPEQYVILGRPAITARVSAFAALAGVLVALAGFAPAVVVTRLTMNGIFNRASTTESRRMRTMRVTFAAIQSALAVVLAIGAAMLVQSYLNLVGRNTGYDESALYVNVGGMDSGARDIARAIEALQKIPGVTAVAATSGRVVGETWFGRGVEIDGVRTMVDVQPVSDRYFEVSGLRILQGRALGPGDERWRGVVVNEAFAGKHWPDGGAIGRRLRSGPQDIVVVGVTQNALDTGLADPATPSVYVALEGSGFSSGTRFLMRVADTSAVSADRIRAAILDVDPHADVGDVLTVGARLRETIRDRTFATMVLAFFGVAGGAVTVAGLVSIVSFVVARRTREIAIRTAVGATPADIRRLVVREAVGAALGGAAVGLVAGRWLSTWLESLVFGIEAGDWTTALAAVAASLAVMIGAALTPAQRALRLPPSDALRAD